MTQHCYSWQHKESGTCLIWKIIIRAISLNNIYIYNTNTLKKSHILAQSNFWNKIFQETMAFLGEIRNETIVNFRLTFIFPNGSMIVKESGVYFQSSNSIPIWVPNDCGFQMLKTRMHNTLQLTDNQYLDKIYYRQSFADTGNQFGF